MTESTVTLRINADGAAAIAGLNKVTEAEKAVGDAGKRAGDEAAAGLNKVEAAASKAAQATRASSDATTASISAFLAQAREVDALVSTQAKSIADVASRRAVYNAALRDGVMLESEHAAAMKATTMQETALLAGQQRQIAVMAQKSLAAEALVQKYAASSSAAAVLAKDEARINELFAAGAISGAQYAQTLASIAAKRGGLKEVGEEASKAGGAIAGMGGSVAMVQREIGVLIGELLRGNFAAFQRSLVTLTRQAGLLSTAFAFMVSPIGLVAAAVGVAVGLYVHFAHESENVNRSLVATGEYAARSALDIDRMSSAVGASTGHFGAAGDAVKALAASGRFAGESFGTAAQGVTAFADLTGEKIEKVVGEFEKLQRDPLKTLEALDEQYHFLTLSQYEQVASLVDMGDKFHAGALAVRLFTDAMVQRDAEVKATVNGWLHPIDSIINKWNDASTSLQKYIEKVGAVQGIFAAGYDPLLRLVSGNSLSTDAFATGASGGTGQFSDVVSQMVGPEEKAKQIAEEVKRFQMNLRLETDKTSASLTQQIAVFGKGAEAAEKYKTQQLVVAAAAQFEGKTLDDVTAAILKQRAPIEENAAKLDAMKTTHNGASKEAEKHAKALMGLADYEREMYALGEKSLTQMTEIEKEDQRHLNVLRKIAEAGGKHIEELRETGITQAELARVQADATIGIKAENAAHEENLALLRQKKTATENLIEGLRYEIEEAGMSSAAREKLNVMRALENSLIRDHVALGSPEAAARRAEVEGMLDLAEKTKQAAEVARGWANIWQQAGDGVSRIFSDVLTRGGSLFRGLRDLAKQTVGSIIDYFAKLAVINPILNSIFGASAFGGSLLPTMANAAIGGGTPLNQTAGIVQTIAQAFGGGGAGAASGGGFDFTSAASWIGAGKNLWEGFSSLFGSGGSQSILGSLAGKGEWDVGGAFGGQLANIGAGIGGAFGGYQLGQGLGLGKGGSLALGAGVGALSYFVPVVGWVMGIASLLNTLSGGNVFGTGWNANGETKTNLSIGAMGANIANQYEEKKKGALFSGNSYRWRDAALSEDQKAYADQITAAMQKVRDSAAGALGVEAANIVTAAFQQRWNKDGKVTEEVSTVMGRTYKETMDKFILRVQAENVLAQIDKALGSGEASMIAEKYRSNADTLSDAAKMLLAAQVDVKHGASLLGDDKSLSNIAAIVGQLKAENEALAATYARLQTETQALKSTLDVMGLSIGKTGVDFVKFADAASNAAGGVDKLQSMLGAFQKAYYSADEIAKAQIAALQRQSQGALSSLGVDPSISMADLRAKIENMMPTLSPDQLVQWINAANLLAAATDAQKQYNAALAKNAADVQAMLGQMNPAGDPNAGTWAATLAAINTQFDAAIAKLTALGATADQLAQAEGYRTATIAKAQQAATDNYNAIVAQITGGIAQFGKPEDGLQKALDTIAQAEAATIAQLQAAAKAAGMQGVAEADLAAVHQFAAMQAQAAKDAAAAAAQAAKEAQAQAMQAYADLAAGIGTALADTLAPLSAYQQALRQSETQLKENIDKLNAAAKAAGMQGAAEADLARAHQLAAAQVRAAIAQLRNSTLDQGKKLGYIDSVDSLTARITDLQNSIGKAASGFEGAAQSVSSAASDLAESMKLALGNLSPYTDEKKLQLALQGLASGTASREDVLGIGRRLYASTDRYAQLYEQVMGMPDLTKQTGGGLPSSFYAGPATPAVDTSAVMLQIEALTKQRDAMLAAQKHTDALAFAQQVADLAQADKIGVGDELAKLGVNIEALAKDLGVNGDVLAEYIATLKRDSLGDTFKDVGARIIEAIRNIGTLPISQPAPISRNGPPVDVIDPIPVPPRERAATREDMGNLTERMADVFKRLSEIADKFADVPERKRQGAALESIAEATADTAVIMPALRRSVDDLVHTLRQR